MAELLEVPTPKEPWVALGALPPTTEEILAGCWAGPISRPVAGRVPLVIGTSDLMLTIGMGAF